MSQSRVDILLNLNANTKALLEVSKQTASIRQQWLNMARMGTAFLGVQVAFSSVARAMSNSVRTGIEFNRMLQDTTDSLRAMALAGSAQGNLQTANRQSAETLGVLRERANSTGQTLDTLLRIFQRSAGVAQSSGIALSDWAQVAADATRAGTNLGMSAEQIQTNLQQLSMGKVESENILARAIGLDGEMLRTAIEAGNVVDVLRSKLAPYQTEIDGLGAAQNRLKNTMQEAWGRVALPLFEQLETSTKEMTTALDGGGGSLQRMGILFGDLLKVTSSVVQAFVRFGPTLLQLAAGFAALRISALIGNMLALSAAARAAREATNLLTAAKLRLAGALKVLGLANPYSAVLTAITTVIGGLYYWNLRSREIARTVREIRGETERIRLAGNERLAAITTEESRHARIKDLTSDLLELEKQITAEKRDQVRAAIERQAQEVRGQLESARNLTSQQIRDNERMAAARRQQQVDIAAIPDNLAALRQRDEEQRLAAMDPTARLRALEQQRASLGSVDGLSADQTGINTGRANLDRAKTAAREASAAWQEELAKSISQPGYENFSIERLFFIGEHKRQAAEAAAAEVAQQQQAIDAAEAALAQRLRIAEQAAQLDEKIAEARRVVSEQEKSRQEEVSKLSIEQIRISEQELKQSYERQGGDARAYYGGLIALAAERWDREIAAAKAALVAALPEDKQAAQIRLANLERQRSIELRGIELQRDRALEAQARSTYETQIEQIRKWVEAVDAAYLSESDAEQRTILERRRKELIQQALELFQRYREETAAAGLPESSMAQAPEFGKPPPPQRSRFEETSTAFQGMGGSAQSYQGAGEGMAGGMMEWVNQLGTVWDQMAQTVQSLASSITSGIGNALTGVIMKTQSWGDALRQIGTTILSTVIGAIVQMAAQWIARQLIMAVAGRAIQAAALTASIGMAAASATALSMIWAGPATLATIATLGGAAAQAPLSIMMAKGTVLGMSAMPGLASGGHTGPGSVNQPAGIVHAGEWVAPQWQVRHPVYGPMISALEEARIGRGELNYQLPLAYMAGGMVAASRPAIAPEPAEAPARPIHISLVDSRRHAERMELEPDVERLIIDVMHRNRGDLFS